jgi:hypothetical protein
MRTQNTPRSPANSEPVKIMKKVEEQDHPSCADGKKLPDLEIQLVSRPRMHWWAQIAALSMSHRKPAFKISYAVPLLAKSTRLLRLCSTLRLACSVARGPAAPQTKPLALERGNQRNSAQAP